MKSQIKYIASSGNEYDLTTNGILHRTATYYDWEWKAEGTKLKHGVRLSSFSREPAQYEAELVLYGDAATLRQTIQSLHNDFENDLRKMTPGRIVWGDYYLDCYIIQSAVEPISVFWTWISNTIKIYAPHPFWVQETHVVMNASGESSSGFLDYPFNYSYDYTEPAVGQVIVPSTFPFTSEFKMIIYGEAVNPRITINGYSYVLYTTIPSGSYVIIDSKQKTVMMYGAGGTKTNIFNFRNKSDSIFEKIPAGNLNIVWDASFGVDMTIFRERSEPEFEEVQ